MYSKADFEKYKQQKGRTLRMTLLCALPGLAIAVAGFAARMEPLCAAGTFLAGAALIFLYDLRLKPVLRYGKYLREIHSGLSRKTAGTLVKIGQDPVYMDGVWLYEVILNIYEDMSEEGERRFLLDCTKELPPDLLGCDVALTSHGNYVLDVVRMEAAHAQ